MPLIQNNDIGSKYPEAIDLADKMAILFQGVPVKDITMALAILISFLRDIYGIEIKDFTELVERITVLAKEPPEKTN